MTQVEATDPFHGTEANLRFSLTMYWDVNTLEWVKGTQATGGGGGGSATEYSEDAAAPANPTAPAQVIVRKDTPAAEAADGDWVARRGTAYGAAYVTLLDTSGAPVGAGGDATAAKQDTGNASLSSIDGKTPALGQALAAASVPVVLTAAQEAALTPPAAITGYATSAKQDTIIGHVDGIEGLLTTIDADTSVLAAVDYATGSDVASLGVTGGGVEASALRVTIANDSTGVVSVDDNGGSLTVDAPVGTPVFVRLSDGASAISTLPVSLASVPSHAVTNAGTFAVQVDGAALTSLQLIDDAVLAEDAAHSSGDKGFMALAVRNDVGTTRSGTDGDYTPISVDAAGRVTTQAGLATVTSSANFTRPSDTTAYASGDVVCNSTSAPTIMTFAGLAKIAGRGGVLTAASLVLGSNPSTKPVYDLFLFDTTVTMDNDNAAFTPTDAELATCVAVISFGVAVVGDSSSNCVYLADVQKAYLTVGATSLYGILVARNAITPTSADTYTIRLTAALD